MQLKKFKLFKNECVVKVISKHLNKKKRMNSTASGLLKGAIAGVAGVWIMDQITEYLYRNEDPKAYRKEKKAQVEGKYGAHVAASRMADAQNVRLNDKQLYAAGKTVHYLMGVMPGAIYGAYRHRVKGIGTWKGLLYGFGLFVVMDEIVAPLLGLTSGPRAYPWQAHARGLAGHLALGAITDASLKLIDKAVPA